MTRPLEEIEKDHGVLRIAGAMNDAGREALRSAGSNPGRASVAIRPAGAGRSK
jgi:hypothetical protein